MNKTEEDFDWNKFFKEVEVINKTKEEMKFTIEGQKGNTISWTTKQVLPHIVYTNYEVEISGYKGSHDVWVNSFNRSSRKFEGLNLEEAIVAANELRTT
jgi:hypothetical protein|tara:strand:+ start:888 stop:1184 length:297 start_codon:yes stop_codon:yes gene_type:complete